MTNKKTYAFAVSYGAFSTHLIYGNLNLSLKLQHRKTIWVQLGADKDCIAQISCITGSTPKTYYSGNRTYGKYIFIVPEEIKVVRKEFSGNFNADAETANDCLIQLPGYSSDSIGFDFYKIIRIGGEEMAMEVAEKITEIFFCGFGDLEESVFIKNAMPGNLQEIIEFFPYQTQGWRRNEGETHLHAVTKIDGVSTFIPFAHSSEDAPLREGVYSRYLKKLKTSEPIEVEAE